MFRASKLKVVSGGPGLRSTADAVQVESTSTEMVMRIAPTREQHCPKVDGC